MKEKHNEKYEPVILEVFTEDDFKAVYPRIKKYANWITNLHGYLGYKINPDDLIQEALARALGCGTDGTYRIYCREKSLSLYVFLRGIIRSIVSHAVPQARKYPHESLFFETGEIKDFSGETHPLITPKDLSTSNPEDIFIEEERYDSLIKEIEIIAQEDDELETIAICILEGVGRPKDIAAQTGMPIKSVYKALYRFRKNFQNAKDR